MRKEDCFFLGKIVSKHSYRGEVLIKLDTDEPQIYENMESVFVALGNSLVPFFIDKSRLHKSSLLRVQFEEIRSEEEADKIMGSELYLPLELSPKLGGNKFYYHEIIGFSLQDEEHGFIGTITGVNDNTSQALIEAEKDGRDVLIPISDEIIQKVDREKKVIYVRTPEGLIDLYLS